MVPCARQADKIQTLTNAAGVECDPIWATLLVKALEGKNVKELLSSVGSGGGAPAAPAAGGAPAAAAAATEEKIEEPKVEEKEESDDDMVRFVSLSLYSCASIDRLFRASGYSIKHWSPGVSYLYYCIRSIILNHMARFLHTHLQPLTSGQFIL